WSSATTRIASPGGRPFPNVGAAGSASRNSDTNCPRPRKPASRGGPPADIVNLTADRRRRLGYTLSTVEGGITLCAEQVQGIHKALAVMERELKAMMHEGGWQRPYVVFNNLQAIRTALAPEQFRNHN